MVSGRWPSACFVCVQTLPAGRPAGAEGARFVSKWPRGSSETKFGEKLIASRPGQLDDPVFHQWRQFATLPTHANWQEFRPRHQAFPSLARPWGLWSGRRAGGARAILYLRGASLVAD